MLLTPQETLSASPAEMGFSPRETNVLESEGAATVRDLIRCAGIGRQETRGLYESALRKIQGELERRGLHLDTR